MELRPGTAQQAGMSPTRIAHISELAQGWVTQGLTSALVVLAARRGVIVLHKAFGRLTLEPDSPPVQVDTLYPLASISKTVTATAAMILVEDSLLGLNRPVCQYVPEFSGEGKPAVLVHHLLTHTSGLRDEDVDAHAAQKYGSVTIPTADKTQHPRVHEWLYLGYDTPLWKPPGVEMSYCNYGSELVGEIVRRVSGHSLADFAQARIFGPLGMRNTYYSVPEVVRDRIVKRPTEAPWANLDSPTLVHASPFVRRRLPGLDSQEVHEAPFAAYGAFSTALDIAIFGQMFLNQGRYGETRILSPAGIAEMTRNQLPGIRAHHDGQFFPEAGWGFDWDIHGQKKAPYDGSLHSPDAFSYGGGGGVFLWVDPLYEIVGVYFSVVLRDTPDGQHPDWPVDLFINAVTAAVDDD